MRGDFLPSSTFLAGFFWGRNPVPPLKHQKYKLIALDTETTGVDLHHGAVPFFVTICLSDGTQEWWEWDVDPVTRKVDIPAADCAEINASLLFSEECVLHNSKFDAKALEQGGVIREWNWQGVHDTLIAAHLLGSNQPKDLTTLVLNWLGQDIKPKEDTLEKVVCEARNWVRSQQKTGRLLDWRIAKKGNEDSPSAKDRAWKYDCWLPRAIRRLEGYGPSEWDTVLASYANADSAATMLLWSVMREEIEKKGLWDHYLSKLQTVPVLMETEKRGITYNHKRLVKLRSQCQVEADRAGRVCRNIAASMGAELELPKGGRNASLDHFCFEVLKLKTWKDVGGPPRNKKAKTDRPSLDAQVVIPHYLETLPPKSIELTFIRNLERRRKYGTVISYLDGYERFGLPNGDSDWRILHPNINPTGTSLMRRSSSNPNEQNISKRSEIKVRSCFGPAPGREWWSFDAKNLELRIPAYESGEQELMDLFEKADEPPYYGSEHLLNFSTVYPDIWETELKAVGLDKVGPHIKKKYEATYYQWCKNGGFAVGYQAVDRPDGLGTADRAFRRPGSQARLTARFSRKEALNRKWVAFAEKHGYVETIPVKGLKRGYPLLCTRTTYGKIKPTVPLNYHIQGTAGEWMGRSMVRVHGQLVGWYKREAFDAWIALEVHDELVIDMPKAADPASNPKASNLSKAKRIAKLMEQGGDDIGVPTPVSIEYHSANWSEGVVF